MQFVADNRAGAGGNIGTEVCAKSPPDGYTVCIMTVAQSIAPAIYRKLAFDPVKDFAHVTLDGAVAEHADGAPVAAGEEREGARRARESASPGRCRTPRPATARARTC